MTNLRQVTTLAKEQLHHYVIQVDNEAAARNYLKAARKQLKIDSQVKPITDSQVRFITGSKGKFVTDSKGKFVTDGKVRFITDSKGKFITDSKGKFITDRQVKFIIASEGKFIIASEGKFIIDSEVKFIIDSEVKFITDSQDKSIIGSQDKPIIGSQDKPIIGSQAKPIIGSKIKFIIDRLDLAKQKGLFSPRILPLFNRTYDTILELVVKICRNQFLQTFVIVFLTTRGGLFLYDLYDFWETIPPIPNTHEPLPPIKVPSVATPLEPLKGPNQPPVDSPGWSRSKLALVIVGLAIVGATVL